VRSCYGRPWRGGENMERQRQCFEDRKRGEPGDPGQYHTSAIGFLRGDRGSACGCKSTMASRGQVVSMDPKECIIKNPGIERPS